MSRENARKRAANRSIARKRSAGCKAWLALPRHEGYARVAREPTRVEGANRSRGSNRYEDSRHADHPRNSRREFEQGPARRTSERGTKR